MLKYFIVLTNVAVPEIFTFSNHDVIAIIIIQFSTHESDNIQLIFLPYMSVFQNDFIAVRKTFGKLLRHVQHMNG
jgi:hypothetical protein